MNFAHNRATPTHATSDGLAFSCVGSAVAKFPVPFPGSFFSSSPSLAQHPRAQRPLMHQQSLGEAAGEEERRREIEDSAGDQQQQQQRWQKPEFIAAAPATPLIMLLSIAAQTSFDCLPFQRLK